MLEALVAIGLAGNVVQFFQCACELISQTNAIQKTGGPSSLADLRKLAESLTMQAAVIEAQLHANCGNLEYSKITTQENGANQACSQEDQHLLEVASGCREASDEFLTYLKTLIDYTVSKNLLRSTKESIKVKLAQGKIEDFASKIDNFRSALSLATILALRAKTDDHNQAILAHLGELKAQGESQASEGVQDTRALQTLIGLVQSQSGPKLDAIRVEIQKCLKEINDLRMEWPRRREDAILRWLNFRQMLWRYEEVPLAFHRTFEWLFQPPAEEEIWHNFDAHLSREDVAAPYWINGKAGSGKSTLMKFIVNHPRTHQGLKKWAGNEQLHVVNFFFWNLGTDLQKSIVGMLRALIHSVLKKYPELIPGVFPSLYQNWKDSDANSEPSYIEVKMAFGLLIEKCSNFLKLCIFIDGIDEFEGTHKDVSMFLKSLASRQVKIIVSSRPIGGCINVFRDCPTLKPQDLTEPDMEIFIQGNLSSLPSMVALTKQYPQEASELVNEIKSKATDVFLWVKIVVRLLAEGLEDGDNITDLQMRFRELPPDLRDLYLRMIDKMKPMHQVQAAEIFRLFHTWNNSIADQPLRTLVLSFSSQSQGKALDLSISPPEQETLLWLCQNIEERIRSRYCGLIEVHKKAPKGRRKRRPKGLQGIENHSAGESQCSTLDRDTESTIEYLHQRLRNSFYRMMCGKKSVG